MCFEKMLLGISETANVRTFKPLPLCSATPENLLVGISGALETKENHFLSKNVFWQNAVGYLRNSKCENVQTFAIGFSTLKTY